MKDIERSLDKAMVKEQWLFGGKQIQRTGNPFEWVESRTAVVKTIQRFGGMLALIRWFQTYDELYPTPDELIIDEYEKVREMYKEKLIDALNYFTPFLDLAQINQNALEGMATMRTVDYCFIKKFANSLSTGFNHLDLGPGLGTHALYSLEEFKSNFYAVEAVPYTYEMQRYFFRYLSLTWPQYLDIIECENFCLNDKKINYELNENPNYRIRHVPSWNFQLMKSQSIDLITATFMLNEISEAGLLWLLSNSLKVLKNGGFFYIRDSGQLKPGKHNINYDELMLKLGFKLVKRFNARNRVDLHGIPRLYQKIDNSYYSYKHLINKCLGHFFVQNLDAKSLEVKDISL